MRLLLRQLSATQLTPTNIKLSLFYGNFDARGSFACKASDVSFLKVDYAIFSGVDSEVAAHKCTITSAFSHANLSNDYLAGFNLFATK
jgi:hypothetical protein